MIRPIYNFAVSQKAQNRQNLNLQTRNTLAPLAPDTVSFSGITEDFAQTCLHNDVEELKDICRKYPEQNMIGELPAVWTYAINKSLLEETPDLDEAELKIRAEKKITEFNFNLGEMAKSLRAKDYSLAKDQFKSAFLNSGIATNEDELSLEPEGEGTSANVFLLKNGNNHHVIKVFKHSEGYDGKLGTLEGVLAETNRAAFWGEKVKKPSMIKWHFSNPEAAFLVSDYRSYHDPVYNESSYIKDGEKHGLHFFDWRKPGNEINGVRVDFGSIIAIPYDEAF